NSITDLAISGKGFFVVGTEDTDDTITDVQYTRAGNFTLDAEGNFKTTNGLTVFGWPLSNELKPGEEGNSNTTPSQLFDSLRAVNVAAIISSANPTTSISLNANFDASTTALLGSSDEVALAGVNASLDADELIVPVSWNNGDDFSLVL